MQKNTQPGTQLLADQARGKGRLSDRWSELFPRSLSEPAIGRSSNHDSFLGYLQSPAADPTGREKRYGATYGAGRSPQPPSPGKERFESQNPELGFCYDVCSRSRVDAAL